MEWKGKNIDAMLIEAGWKPPSPELQAQIDKTDKNYLRYRLKRFGLKHPKGFDRVLDEIISTLEPKERQELLQLLEEQDKEEQA